jgi:hypothetical protein
MFSKLRLIIALLLATQQVVAIAHSDTRLLSNRDRHNHHNQLSKRQGGGGRWSYYNAQTGNAGSCGQTLLNTAFTVAVNVAQMNSDLCFKTIRLTAGGKSTVATIEDTCPGCASGGLDLTEALFEFFAPLGQGYVYGGTWEVVDGTGGGDDGGNNHPSPTTKSKAPVWTPTSHTHTETVPAYTHSTTSSVTSSSLNHSSSKPSNLSSQASTTSSSSAGSTPTSAMVSNLQNLNQIFFQMGALILSETPQ